MSRDIPTGAKRIMVAQEVDLVIGRPITQPPAEIGSPRSAVEKILEELA